MPFIALKGRPVATYAAVGGSVVAGLMLALGVVLFLPPVVAGTVTTVHVDRCEQVTHVRARTTTSCTGHWTAGGRRRSGPIDGVGGSSRGHDVRARVSGDSAYVSDPWPELVAFVGGGLVLGAGFNLGARYQLPGEQRTTVTGAGGG